ncbi:phosphotransferase system, phosphocarrier protein HPr [Salinarchaeum sp. Harcht-Bsk1]|uniref:HPr family phosphocarrier protein n=1 Tax=Salinarchaeum sp. Harcht-Bsk1 TaxID=1333523 RepID=UPI0003423068|nr:HPr family phosphocarrier protein [Salinarchaeum sp. Harcht-Bsk1]AGN02046.1 phosphotransferase system, phosphocarrier protein HPr [Salinarchaeum sp. Harcht-Bsk1]
MHRVVTVRQEAGLHARPAAVFVETANEYDSEITVGPAEGEDGEAASSAVDAGSMLAVTGLGVEQGDRVRITAEGPDAEAALDELAGLLTQKEP